MKILCFKFIIGISSLITLISCSSPPELGGHYIEGATPADAIAAATIGIIDKIERKSIKDASGTMRFSFSPHNTPEEIEYTIDVLKKLSKKFKK